MITSTPFGALQNGEPVTAYTLTNGAGMSVTVLDYACIIQAIRVPDRRGNPVDVALGYDDCAGYEAGSCFFGAFVGRFANRIAGSAFTLDGTEYRLPANEGRNHLHGTYAAQRFDGEIQGDSLVFHKISPDGEEGFPGQLSLTVTYSLTEDNRLLLDYRAETDRPTVLNLTNHTYFNLGGQDSGDTLDTRLTLRASRFTEADSETLTTGRILPVANTPLDFCTGKPIGQDIRADHPMLRDCQGYDLNYVLNQPSMEIAAARAECAATGITLTLYTTQPGVQLYTGNFVTGDAAPCGKGGRRYPQYAGFCLETQHFPCSPNYPQFPSTVLRPGEVYHQITAYQFGVTEGA
ncbi:MAG: galactose mutarotase [Oscillospiraceae bacterium]|nr:galactose mutarotase [Oscillospiraceae bacterium]